MITGMIAAENDCGGHLGVHWGLDVFRWGGGVQTIFGVEKVVMPGLG